MLRIESEGMRLADHALVAGLCGGAAPTVRIRRLCLVAEHDATDDLSGAQLVRFEIKRKDKSINLRLSEDLYDAVRERAARAGLPYQRFIRLTLEQALGASK